MKQSIVRGLMVAAVASGAPFAAAQPDPQTIEKEGGPKPLSEVELRRAEVEAWYTTRRFQGPSPEVIYGNDDRRDIYEISDPFLLGLAQAAAVVVSTNELTFNGNGTVTLNTRRWTERFGTPICPDEPFVGQMQIGFCSAFLVGSDLIVTAGHCVSANDIGSVAFVFGFDQLGPTTDPDVVVPESHVYVMSGLIDRALGGGLDHSLVRVDRDVTGFNPVPLSRTGGPSIGTPLVMIGHPVVLPKKVDDGGQVLDVPNPGFFTANLDAYGGNSGSMVVNALTGEVEGILVRGAPDFVTVGGCVRSNVLPNTGVNGEEVSTVGAFASLVPPLGITVSNFGLVEHIGPTGGPFSNPSVTYTIENASQNPSDYSVNLVGAGPLLLDGSTSGLSGTLGPNESFTVEVSVSPDAGVLASGFYNATLSVDDLTSSRNHSRNHVLEIGQARIGVSPATDLFGSGPVGGPINASGSYTVTSERPTPVTVRVSADQPWIDIDGQSSIEFDLTFDGDSRTFFVDTNSLVNSLPAGLQNATVTVQNLTNNAGDTFREVTLDVGRFVIPATDTPVGIFDNQTSFSHVDVNEIFCVGDVEVEVVIYHTWIGDLHVDLISPSGTVVRLHDRTGGSADDIIQTYSDSVNPPDGPGVLADFIGEAAQGRWTLRVRDNAAGDQGEIAHWALRVAASADPCQPSAGDMQIATDGGPVSITLDGRSGDPDAVYAIDSMPAHGSLSLPGGSPINAPGAITGREIVYTPAPGYAGPDSFGFSLSDNGGNASATVSLLIGTPQVVFEELLDTDPMWQVSGEWQFGAPTGATSNPFAAHTGSFIYGYNLFGNYSNNMPATPLTAGPIDLTGVIGAELEFASWLAIESSRWDAASLEVSGDGFNWTTIWEYDGPTVQPSQWSVVAYDISDIVDDKDSVYIRWNMGPTDGSVVYGGWSIDDIRIRGILTGVGPTCPPDLNGDGVVDADDFFLFLSLFASGDPRADFNNDGVIDADDFFAFLSAFAAGC